MESTPARLFLIDISSLPTARRPRLARLGRVDRRLNSKSKERVYHNLCLSEDATDVMEECMDRWLFIYDISLMNRCVKMAPEVDPATRLEGFSQSDIPVNRASRKALEQVDQMENGKLFGTQRPTRGSITLAGSKDRRRTSGEPRSQCCPERRSACSALCYEDHFRLAEYRAGAGEPINVRR